MFIMLKHGEISRDVCSIIFHLHIGQRKFDDTLIGMLHQHLSVPLADDRQAQIDVAPFDPEIFRTFFINEFFRLLRAKGMMMTRDLPMREDYFALFQGNRVKIRSKRSDALDGDITLTVHGRILFFGFHEKFVGYGALSCCSTLTTILSMGMSARTEQTLALAQGWLIGKCRPP